MVEYILDTCIWIEFFRRRYGIREKIATLGFNKVSASVVTLADLKYGALKAYMEHNTLKHLQEADCLKATTTIYPIENVFDEYADICLALRQKGTRGGIDQFDILIGATARHYGLIVVTGNTKHFKDMPGVKIENWVEH